MPINPSISTSTAAMSNAILVKSPGLRRTVEKSISALANSRALGRLTPEKLEAELYRLNKSVFRDLGKVMDLAAIGVGDEELKQAAREDAELFERAYAQGGLKDRVGVAGMAKELVKGLFRRGNPGVSLSKLEADRDKLNRDLSRFYEMSKGFRESEHGSTLFRVITSKLARLEKQIKSKESKQNPQVPHSGTRLTRHPHGGYRFTGSVPRGLVMMGKPGGPYPVVFPNKETAKMVADNLGVEYSMENPMRNPVTAIEKLVAEIRSYAAARNFFLDKATKGENPGSSLLEFGFEKHGMKIRIEIDPLIEKHFFVQASAVAHTGEVLESTSGEWQDVKKRMPYLFAAIVKHYTADYTPKIHKELVDSMTDDVLDIVRSKGKRNPDDRLIGYLKGEGKERIGAKVQLTDGTGINVIGNGTITNVTQNRPFGQRSYVSNIKVYAQIRGLDGNMYSGVGAGYSMFWSGRKLKSKNPAIGSKAWEKSWDKTGWKKVSIPEIKAVGLDVWKSEDGEYRVNIPGKDDRSAYYTDDKRDAIGTARDMAARMKQANPSSWGKVDQVELEALTSQLHPRNIRVYGKDKSLAITINDLVFRGFTKVQAQRAIAAYMERNKDYYSRKSNPIPTLDSGKKVQRALDKAAEDYVSSGGDAGIMNANKVRYGYHKHFKNYYNVAMGRSFDMSDTSPWGPDLKTEAKRIKYFGQVYRELKKGKKANPVNTQSDSLNLASAVSEGFHQRPVKEIIEQPDSIFIHTNLAKLGDMRSIKLKLITGGKCEIEFTPGKPDCPMLCSDPEARQLYIEGGDQSIDLSSMGFDGAMLEKDKVTLGDMVEITYVTEKSFDDFKRVEYFHKLGEETGVRPQLIYDTHNQHLLISGGDYTIEDRGIVN